MRNFKFGNSEIAENSPTFVIAEIGINHNGDLNSAKQLIKVAKDAGCDAVKFQKRTPEISTPKNQWNKLRETPWGEMTYIDYRHKVEFSIPEYEELDIYAKNLDIIWFASCWDSQAVKDIEKFNVPIYKIASASLTDEEMISEVLKTDKSIILSTGMSSLEEINKTVEFIGNNELAILHTTSTYPCKPEELNLNVIKTYFEDFPDNIIGYSGHETGLVTTAVAVSMGAKIIERHITLDRSMWGTDQAASIEPQGLMSLIKYIRTVEKAMGDGKKIVYESEIPIKNKLRRIIT
tara:strand:+ start:1858 stop:2733 length:876 start_codon:yes stop_codon:yes gene_type:complete